MHYVYLLVNEEGEKYIGYSADLKRRMKEHNLPGNGWTQQRRPWRLVYYEAYQTEQLARAREQLLKSNGSARAALYRHCGL